MKVTSHLIIQWRLYPQQGQENGY